MIHDENEFLSIHYQLVNQTSIAEHQRAARLAQNLTMIVFHRTLIH